MMPSFRIARCKAALALLCLGLVAVTASAAPRELVLVAGGTGGTGREVVRGLLAAERFAVRVLTRDPAAARAGFDGRVELVAGDVRDAASLPAALQGVGYVISAVGSNQRKDPTNTPEAVDYGGTRNLALAARAAGVRHFVLVSSQGVTDLRAPLNQWLNNILVWKYLGEEALRKSTVPYTIVRPSGLRDEPVGKAVVFAQGDTAKTPGLISRADVAAVCVAALANPDAFGKTFEITGDPARPQQPLASEFAALGTDPAPPPLPRR